MGKKLEKLKVQDHIDRRDHRSRKMARDPDKERIQIEIAYWLMVCYLLLLVLLALAISFFGGASNSGIGSTQLLSIYVLYGFAGRVLRKRPDKPDYSIALPRKDYPELYGLAAESAGAVAGENCIHIFVTDNLPHEACNEGLESELEEYRRRAPEFFQLKVDWESRGDITAKADLREEQLPDGWLEKICGYTLDATTGSSVCMCSNRRWRKF